MAKTTKATTEIDTKKFVEMLVKAEFSQTDAQKSVDTLVAAVNANMGDEPVSVKTNVILKKIREKIKAAKMITKDVIVLTVGERRDSNNKNRTDALKMYHENADAALSQGLIKMIRGEPTPVDNKPTLDKAGKWENKNYGKPWPVKMIRDITVLMDNNITALYVDINVEVGGKYKVYGKMSADGNNFYASNDPSPIFVSKMTPIELYNAAYEVMKTSDYAFDVYGATETDVTNKVVMVKGYAQTIGTTGSGKGKVRINDDSGAAITGFAQDNVLSEAMQRVTVNSEVILIGRLQDSDNPDFGRSLKATGMIVNPQSSAASSGAMDKLKDLDF
jgi:hypothetical protein